jgi:hypothetical protein
MTVARVAWLGLLVVACRPNLAAAQAPTPGVSAPAAPAAPAAAAAPAPLAEPLSPTEPAGISSDGFLAESTRFLEREITAHVQAIKSLDPPPAMVLGVPTQGEFTWGSLMRALTDVTSLSGLRTVGGQDVAKLVGKLGLIEARQGGKTFAQLGAALSLRRFGADLNQNALWQSLTPGERAAWRSLLDPGRFYDREKRKVINLPENYFGVAARIAALDHQMGLITDRAFVDDLLDRAGGQFVSGVLYSDDSLPVGRYDRYSQEYARFVYEAAEMMGREDILAAVSRSLQAVFRTWWDLASPDGCGYPWGRTIGAISYMDSLEIVAFLARYPQFRPAPLADLASLYHAAWLWLQQDYQRDRHLLDMFGFGRGNYNYMTPQRQWQQTTSYLGKAAHSLGLLAAALRAEKVTAFPAEVRLPAVARFEWFRRGERPAGVWLVRQGQLRFALPITTGTKGGIADYLPAPHALPGFAAPVEQLAPALVPHLELGDGQVLVASDGADEIDPDPRGQRLRVVWRRWVRLGGEPARLIDPGLVSEVSWVMRGDTLVRSETIRATGRTHIRSFSVMLPSTGGKVATRFQGGRRFDRFEGRDGVLEVSIDRASVPLSVALEATGDQALGRGARGPIPLLMRVGTTQDFQLTPGRPLTWTLQLRALAR